MSDSLEPIIRIEADKICARTGYSNKFDIIISSNQEEMISADGRFIDIVIQAGHPPKLVVSLFLIARTLLVEKKNVAVFKDRLERALSKVSLMDRTLLNPIPRDRAIILYQDARRWIKTRFETLSEIPDNYFSVQYSVTVTDKVSGISFTATGDNAKEAEAEAKKRLSKIIISNQAVMEFRTIMDSIIKPLVHTSEIQQIEIHSKEDLNEVKEVIKYER